MKFYLSLFLFATLFISTSFKRPFQDEAKINALTAYMEDYLGTQVTQFNWNGSTKNCVEGQLSKEILKKVEKRLNYFRKLVGLGEAVLIDSLNKQAQLVALISNSNNDIGNTLDKSKKCFKNKADLYASLSNIGFISENPVNYLYSFIEDAGETNIYGPHRRLMLFSGASEFGYGASDKTEVLYFSKYANTSPVMPPYHSYPPKGYIPAPLVSSRWSFSIPGVKKINFAYATVVMKDQKGGIIKTDLYNAKYKIFDNTLVWEATGMFSVDEIQKQGKKTLKDRGYTGQWISVDLNKIIIDGEMKSFEYKVFILDV
jgi:hypothetical protein